MYTVDASGIMWYLIKVCITVSLTFNYFRCRYSYGYQCICHGNPCDYVSPLLLCNLLWKDKTTWTTGWSHLGK